MGGLTMISLFFVRSICGSQDQIDARKKAVQIQPALQIELRTLHNRSYCDKHVSACLNIKIHADLIEHIVNDIIMICRLYCEVAGHYFYEYILIHLEIDEW
jgi:hypothetical protein